MEVTARQWVEGPWEEETSLDKKGKNICLDVIAVKGARSAYRPSKVSLSKIFWEQGKNQRESAISTFSFVVLSTH